MLDARHGATNGPRVEFEELLFDPALLAETHQGALFTGVAYELWPDGRLRSETEYIDGLPCGLDRSWYSNGRIQEEGYLWREALHGESYTYHDSGAMKEWSWSEFGVPLEWKCWDETGREIDHGMLRESDESWSLWCERRSRHAAGELRFPSLPPRPKAPIPASESDLVEPS